MKKLQTTNSQVQPMTKSSKLEMRKTNLLKKAATMHIAQVHLVYYKYNYEFVDLLTKSLERSLILPNCLMYYNCFNVTV